MLDIMEGLPPGLLELPASQLSSLLSGPTLIHLQGRRNPPLFVTVLLHGNEDTGWEAVRSLLRDYGGAELPRALTLLIGNVKAAAQGKRYLPGQPDYNRIWTSPSGGGDGLEGDFSREVVKVMKARGIFASVDIHNNSGLNPHYACVGRLDNRSLHLASLFSRTVVFTLKPEGIQIQALSPLCPALTVECGQPGQERGIGHAREFIDACLRLSRLSDHPVHDRDIALFRTVAMIMVKDNVIFSFDDSEGDVRFRRDLDHLNFRELHPGTVIGTVSGREEPVFEVRDEKGRDVSEDYFYLRRGEIRAAVSFMPSMFTVDAEAVRQDCFGYIMKKMK